MARANPGITLLLAVVLASSCRPAQPPGPPGVVLIVLDSAGARHFGSYGNARPTTPRIDALAKENTLFEQAHAQASWTLPSTASLLTGRYPPRERQHLIQVTGETLATRLQTHGVRTAGFSENPFVTADFGFARGFEVFREHFPKRLHEANPRDYPRVASQTTVDEATTWLSAHRTEPFFLYVHLLPPHCPYPAPPPFGGRFDPDYTGTVEGLPDTLLRINEGTLAITRRDLRHLRRQYHENLAYGDDQVGRLLDALDRLDLRARTMVIVTADHGEGFREHGLMLHSRTLYQELIHVPLVVRFPAGTGRLPARWPGIVELRAVPATVARAFGLEATPGLLEVLRGGGPSQPVARSWTGEGEQSLGALRTERYKVIVDRRARRLELYDLSRDPREQTDLARVERRLAVDLARELQRGETSSFTQREQPVDAETQRRLRALGYVDGH